MRVAIVDDTEGMLNKLKTCIEECVGTDNCEIKLFMNPNKVLDELERNYEYDIYLLDIQMEQLSGIELAKEIRRLQQDACIVFITSYSKFALACYDIRIKAYQYILKEDVEEKLPEILLEIWRDIAKSKAEYYVLKNQRRIEKINLGKITQIYKNGKNAVFVTTDEEHYERKTLNQVLKEINRPEFLFIDKGIIVNIRQIRKIEGSEITFFDGTRVHISRSNIQKVKCRVSEYWGAVL